jgi:hypothetical protein
VIGSHRRRLWPRPEGELIGSERERAYVRWIAAHAPPLVAAAERMIRERHPAYIGR